MVDEATEVRGAAIRKIQGVKYLIIFINEAFGGNPDIGGLASLAHLPPETTFDALLRFQANAPVVKQLWRDQGEGAFPGFASARRRLKQFGHVVTGTGQGTNIYVTTTPFERWGLDIDKVRAVILPLSKAFTDFAQKVAEDRKREFRIKTNKQTFDQLEKDVSEINLDIRILDDAMSAVKVVTERNIREIAILEALDGMLGATQNFPKKPPADSDKVKDLADLQGRLDKLRTKARKVLIVEPPGDGFVKLRNDASKHLIGLLGDAGFKDRYKALRDNFDIAPQYLKHEVHDAIRNAFIALLASDRADEVVDDHVIPMLDTVASLPMPDLSGITVSKQELQDAIRNAPAAPPEGKSVLSIMAFLAGTSTQAAGNVPGPSTALTAILQTAAPIFISRVVGKRVLAASFAGRMYRYLVKTADLSVSQYKDLAFAVEEAISKDQPASLAVIRTKIDWSARFTSSPTWGAAIGVANAICLIAAIEDKDSSTVKRWANIVSSGSGTVLGFAVAFQRFSTLIEMQIVKGIGGKVIGIIGGIAVIVVGAVSAYEAYEVHDNVGIAFGIGTVVGGALSVAGFLCAAGLAADATVIGLPVGTLLMVAGAILGIGVAIADIIRQALTPGTQQVFEAYLKEFDRKFGPFQAAAEKDPECAPLLNACMDHRVWSFFDVAVDKTPQLFDLGFTMQAIEKIIDEKEAVVIKNSGGRSLS